MIIQMSFSYGFAPNGFARHDVVIFAAASVGTSYDPKGGTTCC